MPFQSEKQRRFLHANHPEIAKRWEKEYANGGISNHFRKRFDKGSDYGQFERRQAHNVAAGSQAMNVGGGQGNQGGGGGPKPHSGPTAAELAAKAAAAAAAKKAADIKAHKEWISKKSKTKKKKIKHLKNINKTKNWMWKGDELGKKFYKNVSFDDALKMEKKWGYNPNYTGKGALYKNPNLLQKYATGPVRYLSNALTSPGSNIAGATPLMRMGVMQPGAFSKGVLNLAGKTLGPISTAYTVGDLLAQRSKAMGTEADRISTLEGDDQTEAIEEYATKMYKPYAHGGILDINESEEIISDDGNDIELTAYNAEFDDPNDLSTGVKSLFMKKGGNVRLGPHTATDLLAKKNPDGTRSKYQPPGHKDAPAHHGDVAHGPGGRFDQPSAPVQTQTVTSTSTGDGYQDRIIEVQERNRKQALKDLATTGPGSDVEKYDTWDQRFQNIPGTTKTSIYKNKVLVNKARDDWNKVKDSMNEKYKKKAGRKIIEFALTKGLTLGIGDIVGVMIDGFKTNKAKNEFIGTIKNTIANYKELGIPEHSPHTDTLIQTLNQELLDLTQKRDEDKDDTDHGPEVPQVVPVHQEIDEYEGTYAMSPWERIKANQQKRAMLVEKGIIQENPIVDESVTDITMEANRGGLANLFRVKNQ